MGKIMPIYEYACPNCRNVFEKWLKLSETTENASCPQCGGQAQHIISHTAFVLKGGGWYVTDYGYRKGASEDGAASTAETPSASPAASGSEHGQAPAPVAEAPQPTPGASPTT
jgi:putative FmdB family regulatory protein